MELYVQQTSLILVLGQLLDDRDCFSLSHCQRWLSLRSFSLRFEIVEDTSFIFRISKELRF